MPISHRLRPAISSDAATIARHRGQMFKDMGSLSQPDTDALIAATEPWIADLLTTREYLGWVIEEETEEGRVIAGAGLHLRPLGPIPGCLRPGRWAHIANVYTAPTHRRLGLARRLLDEILAWCAANAIDQITLAASADGLPLYNSLGFQPTTEMRLATDKERLAGQIKSEKIPPSIPRR